MGLPGAVGGGSMVADWTVASTITVARPMARSNVTAGPSATPPPARLVHAGGVWAGAEAAAKRPKAKAATESMSASPCLLKNQDAGNRIIHERLASSRRVRSEKRLRRPEKH